MSEFHDWVRKAMTPNMGPLGVIMAVKTCRDIRSNVRFHVLKGANDFLGPMNSISLACYYSGRWSLAFSAKLPSHENHDMASIQKQTGCFRGVYSIHKV